MLAKGFKKIRGLNRNSAPFKIQYPMKNQDEGNQTKFYRQYPFVGIAKI